MLREPRRLLSTGVAIALGVAFVAAALLLSASLDASMRSALAGQVGSASVVVTRGDGPDAASLPPATVAAVRKVPGVSAVRTASAVPLTQDLGGRRSYVLGRSLPPLSDATRLAAGALPRSVGEVVVNVRMAELRKIAVGDRLVLATDRGGPAERPLVVGILEAGSDATSTPGQPEVYALDAALDRWRGSPGFDELYVHAEGQPAQLRQAVASVPGLASVGAVVRTADDEVAQRIEDRTSGGEAFTALLLGFAVVAVFVSALVIANTFSILVAQRARQLALLRCVGATRGQVFRSVLSEAALLALAAGAVGVGLGLGLAAGIVAAARASAAVPLTELALTPAALVAPLATGVLVTLAAALAPARRATAIAPLAALRTQSEGPAPARTSRRVLAGGLIALLAGTGALVLGAGKPDLTVGMAGGVVSFVGVLLLATRFVPALTRVVGTLPARLGGVPGALAVDNARRNPRRAAATVSAMLVGVTLITMMSVAAASGQLTSETAIDRRYPADALVVAPKAGPGLLERVRAVAGVERAELASEVFLSVTSDAAGTSHASVLGISPEAAAVLRAPRAVAGLDDDVLLLRPDSKIPDGARVTLRPDEDAGAAVTLRAVVRPENLSQPVASAATLRRIVPSASPWILVRFADGRDATAMIESLAEALKDVEGVEVSGAAAARQELGRMVDLVLAIVVGLLGVAVLIALVGVGNTLGLSVIERTQETGLLRALGLTRAQIRATVGLEALVLAAVAVVGGLALGVGYGIAGTYALLGSEARIWIDIPWGRLGVVAVAGVLAGWLASVLPAARASRISPAAALVAE